MKKAFLRLSIVSLLTCLFALASCKKKVDRELEKEASRMEGTWQVARIHYTVADSLGNTVSDSSLTNQGSLEFKRASEEGSDVFDPVLFAGACANSELVGYFRGKGAGDPTTAGGWSLYWEADPNGERLLVWGIGPSSSYHRTVNLRYEGKGKSERTMSYVYSPGGNANQLVFVSWELEK